MDTIVWFCPCNSDKDYSQPGQCPVCDKILEKEVIEDHTYLTVTPWEDEGD